MDQILEYTFVINRITIFLYTDIFHTSQNTFSQQKSPYHNPIFTCLIITLNWFYQLDLIWPSIIIVSSSS